MYSWWWVELSPETCRVKPLRRINAIVASCCIYFTMKILGSRGDVYEDYASLSDYTASRPRRQWSSITSAVRITLNPTETAKWHLPKKKLQNLNNHKTALDTVRPVHVIRWEFWGYGSSVAEDSNECPEAEDTVILRNAGNYLHNVTFHKSSLHFIRLS